ncbi:MAG: hypothetical protein KAT05_02710 [Spirochaetes bacterium]|nr:hypothetical protein [Spirochaetota bacterium]
MKKIILLILTVLTILIFALSCAPTSSNCKLWVYNKSDKNATDIKIDDTLVAAYLSSGVSFLYWYWNPGNGKTVSCKIDGKEYKSKDQDFEAKGMGQIMITWVSHLDDYAIYGSAYEYGVKE